MNTDSRLIYDEIKENKMDTNKYEGKSMNVVPTSESSIRDNRDRVETQLDIMTSNIEQLFEILDVVLRGPYPTPSEATPEHSNAESGVGRMFETIASQLYATNYRLTELRERIDL